MAADPRLAETAEKLKGYFAKVDAYVKWHEAFKTTVKQQIADAVAADDREETVDISAINDSITTALGEVPETPGTPPVIDPSANG